ncbi:hypothetical protein AgCh_035356 [Apium graveolens]
MRVSLGSLEDVEKKTSELGTPKDSLASKVSDGSSSLAKTSGSAKISDKADFVEWQEQHEGRTTFRLSETVVLNISDMCKTYNDWVPLSDTRIRRRLNIQRVSGDAIEFEDDSKVGQIVNNLNHVETLDIYIEGVPEEGRITDKNNMKENILGLEIINDDGPILTDDEEGELVEEKSKDGNNQIFPVAWVVVSVENKINCEWFLRCLKHELQLEDSEGYTIISDMQKGSVSAMCCARHACTLTRLSQIDNPNIKPKNSIWKKIKKIMPQKNYEEAWS